MRHPRADDYVRAFVEELVAAAITLGAPSFVWRMD
jgi:hypothetical protein